MGDKLTRRALDAWLKNPTGSAWLWCAELRGFGAHRRDDGRAAFVVQFRVGRGRSAKRRRVVLGLYPTMTPEQAREGAADHIRAGWKGCDPVEEKRVARAAQARQQANRLGGMVDTFHATRRMHLAPRSAGQLESLWRRLILPEFEGKIISEIKRRDVAALMDRVEAIAGPSVADRVHEQLSLFFKWYAGRDDDFTTPLVRTLKRHRRGAGARPYTDDELRQFWSSCDKAGLAGAAARLCLLTATRRNETTHARWTDLSGDGIWTIPSERYKTKLEHVIPLSAAAREVLSSVPRLSPYIFSATGCAPDNWTLWTAVVEAGGPSEKGLSWHSLRKTARTLMSRAGVRSDHAERALGHVQGAVERAYDKHSYLPEKRAAFESLAVEIARVLKDKPTGTVIAMRRAA